MEEQLYKKVGKKFVKIGFSDGWAGFPCDGIWMIETKPGVHSSTCVSKLSEISSIKKTLPFKIRIDIITESIYKYFNTKNNHMLYNPRKLAEKIIDDLSDDSAIKYNKKLIIEKINYTTKINIK